MLCYGDLSISQSIKNVFNYRNVQKNKINNGYIHETFYLLFLVASGHRRAQEGGPLLTKCK